MNFSVSISSPPAIPTQFLNLSSHSRFAVLRRPGRISCSSISQVHNYGTMDYERRPPFKWSLLYRKISMTDSPGDGGGSTEVLEQWVAGGNKVTKWDLCRVVKELRKFRRFRLALEVYEWMTSKGRRFKFTSSDAAIQLDLIAKVHGVSRAEDHFSTLSDSLKDKRTHCSLLNAYCQAGMKDKSEAFIQVMKNKDYIEEALPYNALMTLYMNAKEYDRVKLTTLEMRESNISLDIYSYNILMTTYAAMGNMEEMEGVLEQLKADPRVNANWGTYSTLCTLYIKLGHFEKAENCLKEAERRVTGRDRMAYHYLMTLYSRINKKEEVYRIWNSYKSSFPVMVNKAYHSMLSSLIRVGDIEGAEVIYEEWMSTKPNFDPRICNILMSWYIKEGQMEKAQEFLDRTIEKGGRPSPTTWEILADGHIRGKRIPEALSCMKEAASIKRSVDWRPRPETIASFLDFCEESSDIESKEMLLGLLRSAGCLDEEKYKSFEASRI
ncbi:Pentatricopeptide repeat-containing protein [Acorus gramineus]|uniref:Pentatricopeptide repeat-containing protein n=1 Tax=Acorus gramineus TaxID=55184 RepID=A0AAV9BAW9_ACOGR|nr:Pentatricopeptide repeat-containing protein [Acorus gramineus]